jgi:hypothetical protein
VNEHEHQRRALNEALFRDVNERIAETAERFDAEKTEFVCECSDPSCTERVPATLAEYEGVRKKSTTFLLAPGHVEPRSSRRCRRPCGTPSSGSTRAGGRLRASLRSS